MAISTRGRYGVKALLAIVKADAPLSTAAISRGEDISLTYLEQIFNRLKRAGLITARRGARGGYSLSRSPEKISVGDVISVLDGPIKFSHCHDPEHEAECEKKDTCVSRKFWGALENQVNAQLYKTTLKDLSDMESGLVEKARRKQSAQNLL